MQDRPSLLARLARYVLIVMGFGFLTACQTPDFPPAPVFASTQDYTYIVGPGDNINIIVWRNPEISMSVPIRPDGKFSTPLVDELVAQGKTPVQIAREIEKQLERYVRDPVVTVIVTGFVGAALSLLSRGWIDGYSSFMGTLGMILVPLGGVALALFFPFPKTLDPRDLYEENGRFAAANPVGLAAWAAGAFVYWKFQATGSTLPALAVSFAIFAALRHGRGGDAGPRPERS